MRATDLPLRLLRPLRDRLHTPVVRWFVPFLLIAVASTQLGRVFFSGQSRWRGGGFGMYSEFHPNLTQVWLVESGPQGSGPPSRRLSEQDAAPQVARLVGRCMRLRSQACLRDLAAALPALEPPGRRRLELWLPAFDAATGTLSRRQVAELEL